MNVEYRLSETALEKARARVEALTKRAAKIGVEPPRLEVVAVETVPVRFSSDGGFVRCSEDVAERHVQEYIVRVTVPVIQLPGGWSYVATLQHTSEGNIIRKAPWVDADTFDSEEWRDRPPYCEHCHLPRNRIDTYLVRNDEEGRVVQVGSSCINDYLGHDVEAYLGYLAALGDLVPSLEADEDGGRWYGGVGSNLHILDYLAEVIVAIREHGWVPRSQSAPEIGRLATADLALGNYWAVPPERTCPAPDERDRAYAEKVLSEVRSSLDARDPFGLSDYEWNLKVALSHDWLEQRMVGLVASAVRYYERLVGSASVSRGDWVGEPGSVFEGDVKVERVQVVDTRYGRKALIKAVDDAGNVVAWWTTRRVPFDVGDTVHVKAKVKANDEYRGKRETMLSYAKVS